MIWRKLHISLGASPVAQIFPHLPTSPRSAHICPQCGTWVRFLGQEDPLEKEMVIHSSTFAWKIPWTEERGGLQSMGSPRVGRDFTFLSFFLHTSLRLCSIIYKMGMMKTLVSGDYYKMDNEFRAFFMLCGSS